VPRPFFKMMTSKQIIAKCQELGITPAVSIATLVERLRVGRSFVEAATRPSRSALPLSTKKRNVQARLANAHIFKLFHQFKAKGLTEAVDMQEFKAALRLMGALGPAPAESLSSLIRKHDNKIATSTVRARMKKGWSLERALAEPIKYRRNPNSFSSMEQARGLPENTISRRMRECGMTLEEAVATPLMRQSPLSVVARAHGMAPRTVRNRLKTGMPLDKALSTPVNWKRNFTPEQQQQITASGIKHKTVVSRMQKGMSFKEAISIRRIKVCRTSGIAAMARARGMAPQLVRRRMSRGWLLEDALTRPPFRSSNPHGASALAKIIRSRNLSIIPDTVYARMRRYGWSLEDALTRPSKMNVSPNPNSIRSLARAHGFTPDAIYQRMKKGMSLKRALTLPNQKRKPTIASMARSLGLKDSTVRMRMKNGMSLKQALARPKYGRERAEVT
jgi:hypothetical protein